MEGESEAVEERPRGRAPHRAVAAPPRRHVQAVQQRAAPELHLRLVAVEFVEQLERVCGYEVAFDKIKRQVPTYESCTRAPSCAVHAAEEEAQPARKVFVPMRRGP